MIEKPFGRDGGTAPRSTTSVHRSFHEEQVFRIDHYLGKETVQNILVLRFANGIFEPVWNRNFIDHVQITVAESIGVEGRGRFYEEAGALRDIVQNHMLPGAVVRRDGAARLASSAEAVRDERAKVLDVDAPARAGRRGARPVRRAAGSSGEAVPAYRDEDGVAPSSVTETYVAARVAHRQLALGRRRPSTCAPASGCRSA